MMDAQIRDFDCLTSFLGDYGLFQMLVIVLLSLSAVPTGYMTIMMIFLSDTQEYHCKASVNSTRNGSRTGPDSCSRYKVTGNRTETAEPCLDGWIFSTETYTATIVSEVSLHLAVQDPDETSTFFTLDSCLNLSPCYFSGVWCVTMLGRSPFLPPYFLWVS